MLTSKNPELTRNLWLEFTLHRLIGMPLIIGIILYLTYIAGGNQFDSSRYLANISLALFIFFSLWGARNCSASIIDEINQKTWDFQKLSALTPWQMTIGKFIGSSLYPWYGAIIALIIYGVSLKTLTLVEVVSPRAFFSPSWHEIKYKSLDMSLIFTKMAVLFLAALLMQAIAMFGAASSLSDNKERISTFNGLGFVVIAAIIGYFFLYLEQHIWGMHDTKHYQRLSRMNNAPGFISWYGMQFNFAAFIIYTLLANLSWVMIGNYRIIKKELQYRITPTAWCGFLLFIIIFLAGFIYKINAYFIMVYLSLLLLSITYALTFMQPKNITIYRKLNHCLRHKQKKKFMETTPLWIPTFAMATFLSFIACAYALYHIDLPAITDFLKNNRNYSVRHLINRQQPIVSISPFFFVAIFLTPLFMILRDILIIHYFNLASNRKRGNLTALIYLFLLYAVLPVLLLKLKLPLAAHTLLPLPLPSEIFSHRTSKLFTVLVPWLTIVAAFTQMALVAWLLKRKLRKNAEVKA